MFEAYPLRGSIGNADMIFRVSRKLTGPWSRAVVIYSKLFDQTPNDNDIIVYAGKYHPELTGAAFIFTYATNTINPETLWKNQSIYYPRFLKIDNESFIDTMVKELPPEK